MDNYTLTHISPIDELEKLIVRHASFTSVDMITMQRSVNQTLSERLSIYRNSGLLRQLQTAHTLVDFCSNDYLGFARSADLKLLIQQTYTEYTDLRNGATGSRLLAGQTVLVQEIEQELAQFYQTESALIFNSGYDANLGLLACLPRAGDTLLTDELIHASMIDGARLSYATRHRFRHNDLEDVKAKLKAASDSSKNGQLFVAVESVYSMDGDVAPLRELADLCEQYGAALLVDEAHATGLYGPNGEGLVVALGLQERVLARVHTFGKALGVHGAAIVGPDVLRDYLINFARPFMYTTALPPHSLLAIQGAHQYRRNQDDAQIRLQEQLAYFRHCISNSLPHTVWTNSQSPIQCLLLSGNEFTRYIAQQAQGAGLDVRAILSPTVPAGQERLRLCIHAFNTTEEIDRLFAILSIALANEAVVHR